MVRAPVVFTFVALLACGAERPDPEREVVEVITPPTGMYQVTARVLSDSCVPAWVTHERNGGCVTQPACMTRVEHEFQLVEPMCAASCTRGAKPTSQEPLPGEPQRMQVECDC